MKNKIAMILGAFGILMVAFGAVLLNVGLSPAFFASFLDGWLWDMLGACVWTGIMSVFVFRWMRHQHYYLAFWFWGIALILGVFLGAPSLCVRFAKGAFTGQLMLWGIVYAFAHVLCQRFLSHGLAWLWFFMTLGIQLGALGGIWLPINAQTQMRLGAFCMILGCGALGFSAFQSPLEKITFFKDARVVQDTQKKRLVFCVWGLTAFLTAAGIGLLNLWYLLLAEKGTLAPLFLALGWLMIGGLGLITLLITRHLPKVLLPVCGIAGPFVGMLLGAIGAWCHTFVMISCGLGIFWAHVMMTMPILFAVFLFPLAHGRRLPEKEIRFWVIVPLSGILTSLLLRVFQNEFSLGGFLFVLSVLFLALCWLGVRWYTLMMLKTLRARLWHQGPLWLTHRIMHYILGALKHATFNDKAYFLSLLEHKHFSFYCRLLKELFIKADDTLKGYLLDKMARLDDLVPFLKILEKDFEKQIKLDLKNKELSLLIKVMHKLYPYGGTDRYLTYLDDKNLKTGALTGFLSLGGDKTLMAMDGLQKLGFSAHAKDNIMAAQIIQQAPHLGFVRIVENLLKRPQDTVVQQALLASGAVVHPLSLPAVFQALDKPSLQEYALKALRLYGKKAFPPLEKMLQDEGVSVARRQKLVLFLSSLPSGEGKKILLRSLNINNRLLRKVILQHLLGGGIFWIHKDRQTILKKMLYKDLEDFKSLWQLRHFLASSVRRETTEIFARLQVLLTQEITLTRQVCLYQIALLLQSTTAQKAIKILLDPHKHHWHKLALATVQDFLPRRLFNDLYPLLKGKEPPFDKIIQDEKEFILTLFQNTDLSLPVWVKALCLYAMRSLNMTEAVPLIKQTIMTHPSPVVVESALWVLGRLEKNKAHLGHFLMKVPTAQLAGHHLDELIGL